MNGTTRGIEDRQYQQDCITGNRDSIIRGNTKLANILPTGSGKTTIFGQIISAYLQRNSNKRAIVVSHLGLLTKQSGDRFRDEWGIDSDILQGSWLPRAQARCVITTMQSCRDEEKLKRWSKRCGNLSGSIDALEVGLLVIDECHISGAKSYQEIIAMFPNAIILGFTATPFRQNKLMTNLFDDVAYTVSMQELIDQGYLVEPKIHLTPYGEEQEEMYASIVHIYKEKHMGESCVVYLKTIEECNTFRNVMVENGITCSAVTSKLTGNTRDELLEKFRKGEGPNILVTVDVLTAGFDAPNLRAIFMPYKVGSITTYLQRVGRGLRPYEGKEHCDIYARSDSPSIEDGFWEEITRKILNAGKREYDNYLDQLEFGELSVAPETYHWTKEVVDMAKQVKAKGMDGLFDLIISKQLEPGLLNMMIQQPPMTTRKGAKTKATPAQVKAVGNIGIDPTGLTKQECGALIHSFKLSKGWTPQPWEIVPSGKHAGKHFNQVPPMYWKTIASSKYGKFGTTKELVAAYSKYKSKIKGGK